MHMAKRLADRLFRAAEESKQDISIPLLNGAAGDYTAYREMVATYLAMEAIQLRIEDEFKKLNADEDDDDGSSAQK